MVAGDLGGRGRVGLEAEKRQKIYSHAKCKCGVSRKDYAW